MDEEYWDDVAGEYDGLYATQWSQFENSCLERDLKVALELAPGNRVLDIGCGTGLAFTLLSHIKSDIDYVGLDISAGMLREFRKEHPLVKTMLGSGEKLLELFEPSRFDLVISTNVAASFPRDVRQMLTGIARVLSGKGIASMSFVNKWSFRRLVHFKFRSAEQYRTRGDRKSDKFAIANTFSSDDLKSLFSDTGFCDLRYAYGSVLGGIWEDSVSICMERALSRVIPVLGHSITVQAKLKPREARNA